jgi:hybrid cluster-associated redox disulfide protein
MKKIALPTTDLTVDEVMQRWPATVRIFLDFGMHCVGCPIAAFHSVDEACRAHGIDLAVFLETLLTAALTAQARPSTEAGRERPSARSNSA